MKPLIGLSGRRWTADEIPALVPALAGEEVDLHLSEYPKVIAAAGGLPVELAREAGPADIVARLDGLVMTGGADPDPDLYGHEPHPRLGATERERDEWELALIRAALEADMPMLCVCRGAQMLNVALGGTLVQHLDDDSGHANWHIARTTLCHTVRFAAGSQAQRIYGDALATNSLHHQAVDQPGRGVVVTGRADDGVVEALEVEGRPEVLAVQWHPEMVTAQPDPAFVWLVRQASRTSRGVDPRV
jgi:putative glutamine amidotransferase